MTAQSSLLTGEERGGTGGRRNRNAQHRAKEELGMF